MPFVLNDDGTARFYDWDDPRYERAKACGHPSWGTLFEPVMLHGVKASVFVREMRVEPVYSAKEALEAYPGPLPDPVAVRASYRVLATGGGVWFQGIHPNDIPPRYRA